MPDSGLLDAVRQAFSPGGALADRDPHYAVRPPQMQMAEAVARALDERRALVVEAGTGVGKTFAYLVPLLLSGRRALVSTATKSLQDQLFLRDLPALVQALGLPARLALLKGRSSYLCLHRLERARTAAELPDRASLRALARVEAWAPATATGDLAEIAGLDDRSPIIPVVTSTRDNCLGSECPQFANCHVVRARREAMQADLVVVNHHLFFADLALRDSGVAELLPSVDAAVFDEAHQLVDAGLPFLGTTLASGQVRDLCADLLSTGLQQARGLRPWPDLAAGLDRPARDLVLAVAGVDPQARAGARLRWPQVQASLAVRSALQALGEACRQVVQALEDLLAAAPEFGRLSQRLEQMAGACARFLEPAGADRVRWVDRAAQSVRLVESPLDIASVLSEQRARAPKAWVFTSATLGDDEALSWFTGGTGLQDADIVRVGSPFDYPRQARLWVPRPFPRPAAPEHALEVARLAARCAGELGGRTFVLTTTLRVLPTIARALREALQDLGGAWEVLVQGEQPRRALMQQFGDGRRRILVGSQSFWEGIDVPGDALQCVLIDKLPFPPPDDPLIEARGRQIQARGGDPFGEGFVAEAAVSLKQGGGRLIRSEQDLGLLVVCDPRLASMAYGARLRAALPPMRPLDSAEAAMDWLRQLTALRAPD